MTTNHLVAILLLASAQNGLAHNIDNDELAELSRKAREHGFVRVLVSTETQYNTLSQIAAAKGDAAQKAWADAQKAVLQRLGDDVIQETVWLSSSLGLLSVSVNQAGLEKLNADTSIHAFQLDTIQAIRDDRLAYSERQSLEEQETFLQAAVTRARAEGSAEILVQHYPRSARPINGTNDLDAIQRARAAFMATVPPSSIIAADATSDEYWSRLRLSTEGLRAIHGNSHIVRIALPEDQSAALGWRPQRTHEEKPLQQADTAGEIDLIVRLRVPNHDPRQRENGAPDYVSAANRAAMQVLESLPEGSYREVTQIGNWPFLRLSADASAVKALINQDLVDGLEEDVAMAPSLTESMAMINAPLAWSAGYRGEGQYIAIIDTGLYSNNPAFWYSNVDRADGACFGTTNSSYQSACECAPQGDACPFEFSPADTAHGTTVAHAAAGYLSVNSTVLSGAAPRSTVVSIKASSKNRTSGRMEILNKDMLSALSLINGSASKSLGAAVNISFGIAGYCSSMYTDYSALSRIVSELNQSGVAVVASTGNDSQFSMTFPACVANVISVGATNDLTGQVSSYSNFNALTTLVAPGDMIYAAQSQYGWGGPLSGTSLAAPQVSGLYALLKQALPTSTLADRTAYLRTHGVRVQACRNGNCASLTRAYVSQ